MQIRILITSFIFCLFQFSLSAQIEYEKGYIIDNNGQRKEVFIKNKDWRYNPRSFSFKLSETGQVEEKDLEEVAEFGFTEGDRYIRKIIKVDMSSNNPDRLSSKPGPEWEEKTLFLKVLMEGKASLYGYESDKLLRFFYKIDDGPIEQLVYKRYYTERPNIRTNFQFRQQLTNNLSCGKYTDYGKILYVKKNLFKVFENYNSCNNASYIIYSNNDDQLKFHGSLKVGLQSSRLTIDNAFNGSEYIHFDRELGFRIGAELEIVLPFNKNKWSVLVEPSYQSYNSERMIEGVIDLFERSGKIEYRSIEVPLGLRYYMFLNEDFTLFLNGFYVSDLIMKSKLSNQNGTLLEGSRNADNFAAGLGLKFKNTVSMEFRYSGARDIVRNESFKSEYGIFALILGANIF